MPVLRNQEYGNKELPLSKAEMSAHFLFQMLMLWLKLHMKLLCVLAGSRTAGPARAQVFSCAGVPPTVTSGAGASAFCGSRKALSTQTRKAWLGLISGHSVLSDWMQFVHEHHHPPNMAAPTYHPTCSHLSKLVLCLP